MKIAYVVSMFPRLSETFILNELLDHEKAGVDVSIFSIKKCNESVVHDKAVNFVDKTTYIDGDFWIVIWFLHLFLLASKPFTYLSLLYKLLVFKNTDINVKIKSLIIFFYSPYFYRSVRRENITYLHAHFATYPALLAWIISKFSGIPFSVTAHAYDIYLNQDILKIISDDVMNIVTISDFNKKFILEKLGWKSSEQADKIQIIHCGIDLAVYGFNATRRKPSGANGKFRILSVGRLSGIKGFSYLLDALSLLKQDGYDFSCEIIGNGPFKDKLATQLESLKLGGCVTFLGAKKSEEVLVSMSEADLFVLACAVCKNEGQDGIPVAFMEAMALGVPVIGTRISGIPELIVHGKTGLCAETENPVSLKNNIATLIDDYGQTFAMVKNARSIIEQEFDIEKNSRRLREIFAKGCSKASLPTG